MKKPEKMGYLCESCDEMRNLFPAKIQTLRWRHLRYVFVDSNVFHNQGDQFSYFWVEKTAADADLVDVLQKKNLIQLELRS